MDFIINKPKFNEDGNPSKLILKTDFGHIYFSNYRTIGTDIKLMIGINEVAIIRAISQKNLKRFKDAFNLAKSKDIQ